MQKHAKDCINLQKCAKRVKVDNNSKKYNKMINRQKLPKNEPKLAKTGGNGQEQAKTGKQGRTQRVNIRESGENG